MHEPKVRNVIGRISATLAALAMVAAFVPSIAAAKTVEIKMSDTPPKFLPMSVTIDKGDTVEWINNAQSLHSVTTNSSVAQDPKDVSLPAGAKPFDSGFMPPGAKWSYTFTVPGPTNTSACRMKKTTWWASSRLNKYPKSPAKALPRVGC